MANILLEIGKGIEVGAEDLLKWVTLSQKDSPAAVAALGVLLGAVASALNAGTSAAAADGLNIALDVATATAIKQAWPDLVTLAASLGIKI